VNFLWTIRHEIFFVAKARLEIASHQHVHASSIGASLVYGAALRTIHRSLPNPLSRHVEPVSTPVRLFQELIAGHQYQIEVTAVSQGRWRADIVRIPGVPTALMPFYGPTPDEAADHLRQWLTRAYDQASTKGRRV
jgi:hypothetical protein